MRTIWWIRRDLRLSDNQALAAALRGDAAVVPLFVLDPALLESSYVGQKRLAFLFDGLRRLDEELQARGSRLVVRRGRPRAVLHQVMEEAGAAAIFAEEDHSPFARKRDTHVAAVLPLTLCPGVTVHPPDAVMKGDGTPYTVFTPYSRRWKALPPLSADDLLPAPDRLAPGPSLESAPIPSRPTLPAEVPFVAGETEAGRRLMNFVQGQEALVYEYGHGRNLMGVAATSGLSPYLRFGMLSARTAAAAAFGAIREAAGSVTAKSAGTWLNELIWREFYVSILYHFPHVRQHSFRPGLRDIPWLNDREQFDRWCQGQTGYPVVDASMRQLAILGWMHNRGRMITASFLVKHLLIDWRWGERWFMQQLVDGDPAANNGGWQWTAGTGTDAAPYFRVFNPILQGGKFDADGAFVRRWVPELNRVPLKYLHRPWEMPAAVQREASCVIGRDYPEPIVDHATARKRALAAYKAAGHLAGGE